MSFQRMIFRVMVVTSIWFLFAGWSSLSWIVGIPVVLTVMIAFRFLPGLPAFGIHPVGVVRFVIYFVQQSLLGGIDVAWRAFHPRCPLSPGLIQYDIRLANGFAVVVFINVISLLPGTLSVDLQGQRVTVHALDLGNDIRKSLSLLELRVAELFGEELSSG